MRNFISSVIYSLILTLLSVAVTFLLLAPLSSLVYYGLFASDNLLVFIQNIIGKTPDTNAITIILMAIQIALSLGFVTALFLFIRKTICVFLRNEKLVRPYYMVFFFMTSVVPVALVFVSVFFRVKLSVLSFVITGVFSVLNIVLVVFNKKIFPETTDREYRKYLFSEDSEDA